MRKTALVVDDSATVRGRVADTLKQAGFELLTGGNGQEALDRLTGCAMDLIVTDLHMPVMDGLTFIRAVRARDEYKGVPILMLTNETQADVRARGTAAGVTGWLAKPFDPGTLLKLVGEVMPGAGSAEPGSHGRARTAPGSRREGAK